LVVCHRITCLSPTRFQACGGSSHRRSIRCKFRLLAEARNPPAAPQNRTRRGFQDCLLLPRLPPYEVMLARQRLALHNRTLTPSGDSTGRLARGFGTAGMAKILIVDDDGAVRITI